MPIRAAPGSDCPYTYGFNAFSTIHAGVAQVQTGGTVNVAAGTYHEAQIIIDKGLTLSGAGAATTIVDGGGESNIISTSGILYVTRTSAAQTVTIQGLTLQNAGTPADEALDDPLSVITASHFAGPLSLQNDVLVAAHDSTAFDPGVVIYDSASTAPISIAGNDFSGMFQGLLVEDAHAATSIAGNTFHDLLLSDGYTPEGLFVLSDDGQVQNNLVSVNNNTFEDYAGYDADRRG